MTLAVASGAPSCRAIRHPRPGGAADYPDSDLQLRGLRRPRCRAPCCIAAEPTSLAVGCGSGSCPEFQPSQMMVLAAADDRQQRSQPEAQSAGQRRIASPAARRWLSCTPRVRWSAAGVRSRRSWEHCPLGVSALARGTSSCATFACATSPGARASMRKGRARLQLPPRPLGKGARDVREVYRPGAAGCGPGSGRGQDAQPQLHRYRAHPARPHP